MTKRDYVETFDHDAGGWIGWEASGMVPLTLRNGAAISQSPWWVDYNHAPPGAGYLHLHYVLHTKEEPQGARQIAGVNRFIADRYPRDFTNAKVTTRLRGNVTQRGAQLVLLVQADVGNTRTNWVLSAQPVPIKPDWHEHTMTLVPDEKQWTCLGSRHNRTATYGKAPIADALRDVNCDIIFVLFPLNVVPAGRINGDMHMLRADRDYSVNREHLPDGRMMLDEVRIAF